MANIQDVADFIIASLHEGGETHNLLKLQKLAYYTQAWHLAFYGCRLFEGRFQAWVHGPVNRELYDRFAPTKSLYSEFSAADIRPEFDPTLIRDSERQHINSILEEYAKFSGSQLEEMTHNERPWQKAREGFRPSERCEKEIDENLMQQYYAERLKK